jgi:hypothetical protein
MDTVGLDADMIRKYVRYQEKKAQQLEQLQLFDKQSEFGTTHMAPRPTGADLYSNVNPLNRGESFFLIHSRICTT